MEKEAKKQRPNPTPVIPTTSSAAANEKDSCNAVTKATTYDVTEDALNNDRKDNEQWEDPLTEPQDLEAQNVQLLISETNVPTFRILRRLIKDSTRAEFNSTKLNKLLEEKHLP